MKTLKAAGFWSLAWFLAAVLISVLVVRLTQRAHADGALDDRSYQAADSK